MAQRRFRIFKDVLTSHVTWSVTLHTRTYIYVYIYVIFFCDIYNAVPVCAFAVRVLIVPCAMCFAYCGAGNKMEGAEPAHQRYLFSESDTFFAV